MLLTILGSIANKTGALRHDLVDGETLIFLEQMFVLGEINIHQSCFAAPDRLDISTNGAITVDGDAQVAIPTIGYLQFGQNFDD